MTTNQEEVLYLTELMADRERLSQTPGRYKHVERLVDQEIVNVRSTLFDQHMTEEFELPLPCGDPKLHKERVYIPESSRKFNFVGRLLGPRGKTLKRIEQDTGCKIMIRGEGSVRKDSANQAPRYDAMSSSNYYPVSPTNYSPTHHPLGMLSPNSKQRGPFFQFSPPSKNQQPTTFHQSSMGSAFGSSSSLASQIPPFCNPFNTFRSPNKADESANEPLHVLIQCEDTPNRAAVRLHVAKNLIMKLFQPVDDAHDELKQKQLLELSLMNGTFKASPPKLQTPRKQWPSFSSKSPSFNLE
ncbi:KH domain-containing protein [Aphelenchoides besseyi]|nr:KH domain-containing protein [Aphelenchoides besseyi]KAI6220270.1 KH domain-containing protein [Aphelenchoides besseyi]